MMRTLPLFLIALTTCAIGSAVAADASAKGENLPQLFDGKTLKGWHGRPHLDPAKYAEATEEQRAQWQKETEQHWTVENGELVNDGHGPYLTTNGEYGDYELRLEYRTVAGADSGIYLRGVPQVQIWDTTDESKFKLGADKGSGGLWNNAPGAPGKDPLVKADRPFGEWNDVRVVHTGERVSVWLNDKLVVDHARMDNYWDRSAPLPAKGPIQLQTHGGEIRWRNIGLRELSADEANEILSSHGDEGFTPLFDGKTLKGWQGAVDDYQVEDGAIVSRPGRGGNLYTDGSYGDFVVRLEFKLPPGGNNGLAIRYPGEGNPSVTAMTELQVLDNTAEKYATLDPRQYHGSAYGMAAAKRGYLRPVGEWNFQEVTVRGSTIVVELNGTVILDTDVSKIEEFMKDAPPGRNRTEGHFGFAGHSDPVRFREVDIKKLDQ